ncbi:MAG: gluconate 2-dehydrogenase subunit 3 family protein [Maribacter sp.]|nr:gluconate 2-dehydrogenase subunit 3 family protein [Maribacter sp.]
MDRRTALKKTSLLIGAGITVTISSSILQSCADKADKYDWQPQYLTSEGVSTVDQIAHILIPDEEVPEATKKLIPKYIDTILAEYTPKEQQTAFETAFEEFNSLSASTTGKGFLKSSVEEKLSFLKNEEKRFLENGQPTYFGTVKQLVYEVFFKTEVGVTQYLIFNPLPGKYHGCVPLSEVNGIIYSGFNFSL